jgi:hypothetical protein
MPHRHPCRLNLKRSNINLYERVCNYTHLNVTIPRAAREYTWLCRFDGIKAVEPDTLLFLFAIMFSVSSVPIAASHHARFSVSFRDNRHSDSVNQRPSCAHSGPSIELKTPHNGGASDLRDYWIGSILILMLIVVVVVILTTDCLDGIGSSDALT